MVHASRRRPAPRRFLLLLLSIALLSLPAAAQSRRQVSFPPADFDAGIDTRIREVTLHNLLDFDYDEDQAVGDLSKDSDTHFFRVRHRVWGQLKFRGGFSIYSRFTTEWRKYLTPYESPHKTEIILDNLYLDLPRIPYVPFSLRIGRQDLIRGEGFLLLEGGPNDGSRSIYHNAVLLTLLGARIGVPLTKFELIAIRNMAWDDLIVANGPSDEQRATGQARPIVENDETALALYVTRTNLARQKLETYYFYKEEEAPSAQEPHLKLNTIGARISGELPWSVKYATEGAYQFGRHYPACRAGGNVACGEPTRDHRSCGGYASFSRSFLTLLQPTLQLGAIYLSGDDIDDPDDEVVRGWHPLFSRWPKWSELYIYSLIPEGGRVADWSNLIALQAGLSLQLSGKARLSYNYYYMRAPEPLNPTAAASSFFGDGQDRGHNQQWKLAVEMTPHVSWHFLLERFAPGDFYNDAADDAYFVRWELILKS